MKIANYLLFTIDGKKERTLAYPCSQDFVGPREKHISIKPIVETLFFAARTYSHNQIIVPENLDFYSLPAFAADLALKNFDTILRVIDAVEIQSGWVILVFHVIGENDGPFVFNRNEHRKTIEYLSQNKERFFNDKSPLSTVHHKVAS